MQYWIERNSSNEDMDERIKLKANGGRILSVSKNRNFIEFAEECDSHFRHIFTKDEALALIDELRKWVLGENEHENTNNFYDYDERGVKAFTKYSELNGKWSIELYRKKTTEESKGVHDWKMIRIGHVQTYDSRLLAEKKAIELAESICLEYGF